MRHDNATQRRVVMWQRQNISVKQPTPIIIIINMPERLRIVREPLLRIPHIPARLQPKSTIPKSNIRIKPGHTIVAIRIQELLEVEGIQHIGSV